MAGSNLSFHWVYVTVEGAILDTSLTEVLAFPETINVGSPTTVMDS